MVLFPGFWTISSSVVAPETVGKPNGALQKFLGRAAENGFRCRVDKADHAEAIHNDDAVRAYRDDIAKTGFTGT